MSIISSTANYGGRVDTQHGNVKQFIYSSNLASWIFKKIKNGLTLQTPSSSKYPVLISNDLIVTGSIYNNASDIALKNNIQEIEIKTIEDLFILNPIIYSYKNDPINKKHYGILAEEFEQVFPELVDYNTEYKIVNYQELIPIMLAKMKKMQNDIEELKNA